MTPADRLARDDVSTDCYDYLEVGLPWKPKKPCAHAGCRALTDGRYCPTHLRQHRAQTDAQRGTASGRGYGARHREWREEVLRRDPWCVMCRAQGLRVRSTVADHIVAIRNGGARFDPANGQGLCKHHHDSAKQSEEKKWPR